MGGQDVTEIERHILEVVPQARLMEGADRPGGQPGGYQQNKQAGPLEENAEVKTDPTPVEQETEHHRGCQTQYRAERRPDPDILLESSQQEEDRLQPFTRHGEEDHHDQCPAVVIALCEGAVHRLFQLNLNVTRHFAHPEHHPGEDHHRNDCDDAFKQLLLFLREFPSGFVNRNPQTETEGGRQENANPHHPNPATALGSFQIAGDQADNKGRFEAFT